MENHRLRHHSGSVRDSAIGPLFLLMLLAVSSFASIVTELDGWREVRSVAESLFIVIAHPAALDAVVEPTAEAIEGQAPSARNTLLKAIVNDAHTALVCLGPLSPALREPPPRLAPACCSDRPRGPPASG